MIVASGVRSSWLALATKSVRIRSAATSRERSDSRTRLDPSASGRVLQMPGPVGRADPDQVDLGLAVRQDGVERERMADRKAQVAADDRRRRAGASAARLAASVRWLRTISAGSSIASRIAPESVGDVGHGAEPNRRCARTR